MAAESFLIIVTGLSGAGKTQAVRALEDLGYFCIDNLLPNLIPRFLEVISETEHSLEKIALVMDIRGGKFFDSLTEALAFLAKKKLKYEILFLEASDETLVRRFKETRRRHPLATSRGILEAIKTERKRLEELRGRAHKIIDTSELTPQQLKEEITLLFGAPAETKLAVTITSFGYKYGIPLDADLVMDVRFLPNPHYLPELRPFSGHDQKIKDYVLASPVTQTFLNRFSVLLDFLIPYYIKEGKTYLVIAVGCTGGRHRSVVLANEIASWLRQNQKSCTVLINHRDVEKG